MSIVDELKNKIEEIQLQISEIQAQCSHPDACVTAKNGSSTGGWVSDLDEYWTDYHCRLCDKKWKVDK